MSDPHLDIPDVSLAAAPHAAPLLVKCCTLSVALHAAALGGATMWGGLYTSAHIGARGGPMSIEAINSPESLGELDEGRVAAEPAPQPPDQPVLESALAAPPQSPPPAPKIEEPVEPQLPELEEPLLARVEPKPDPEDSATEDEPPPSDSEPPSAPPETNDAQAAARSLPSAGSIGHAGNDSYAAPRFAHNAPIAYPVVALEARMEGEVLLRLHIAADGRVTAVDVIRSSGHDVLDRAAANSVRSCAPSRRASWANPSPPPPSSPYDSA